MSKSTRLAAQIVARVRAIPVVRTLVLACAGIGVALLVLLSRASSNTELFSRHYPWLLGLGGLLALGLLTLVGYQLSILRRKLKSRMFGSRLTVRLVVVFALMALVPGVLVYAVSVQFLARSIESWFDVRVDRALEGGLNLGRSAIDGSLEDLHQKAETMAQLLVEKGARPELTRLHRLREQYGVEEAALVDNQRRVIAFSSSEPRGLLPDLPSASILRQVRSQQPYLKVESIPERGLYLRVVVPVNVLSLTTDILMLQVLQPVPREIARNAEQVQAGYRDYQELTLSRVDLKRIFGLTLTLALLLTLLSAIALAFLISERFSAPLSLLAESTRAIAKGDFSKVNPVRSHDEFGVLTRSFNMMTRQLAEASQTVARNRLQLEQAKSYVESLLGNLTAGVLAFDAEFRLRTINEAAIRILELGDTDLTGAKPEQWAANNPTLASLAARVMEGFGGGGARPWEGELEYLGPTAARTLHVRGTGLPPSVGGGFLVVFDDITRLIQAQRNAAWGEVARRLAHEIKNPLTPIQLSAERLNLRLADKLPPAEAQMLARATETIVNQVSVLKHMVNDFSEYARLARMMPARVALNDLIREVTVLYESMGAKIALELTHELPPVWGDPALLRQVLVNLLQNAVDSLQGAADPRILLRTEPHHEGVKFSVLDNGTGFSEALLARVFEPYVTTKPKGTGLGLAIVKRIVDEHSGSIQVSNVAPHGANVSIVLPLAA